MQRPDKNVILIVFRDYELVESIISALGNTEYDFISATSSIEALSSISFSVPKVIISELNLENENGYDLCQKIRAGIKTKLIPFIIVSDNDIPEDRITSIKKGADAFLVKPLNKEEILAHIRTKINQFNEFYLLSVTDELTRLYNRREFFKKFDTELNANPDMMLSLSIIDLDFFKQINDIHGHQMGDMVLMQLAEILKKYSSNSFFPTRFGGEEFVILFPGLTAPESKQIVDTLREEFHSTPFTTPSKKTFHVSFSAGISEYPSIGKTLSILLSRADQALYAAKKEGRGRTYIFSPIMARNDRFWEHLKQSKGIFIDKKGFDGTTHLPFLPQVLDTISALNFEVKSIGTSVFVPHLLIGSREYLGNITYDYIMENIKVAINKSCENNFASDTYIAVNNIINYDFIILFPSIVDFSMNYNKCLKLFNDIANDIELRLSNYPVEMHFASSVLYLNKTNAKGIVYDIFRLMGSTIPVLVKEEYTKLSKIILNKNETYTINNLHLCPFKDVVSHEAGLSYYSFFSSHSSYTINEIFLNNYIKNQDSFDYLCYCVSRTMNQSGATFVIPYIESVDPVTYIKILTRYFSKEKLIITINEYFIYRMGVEFIREFVGLFPEFAQAGISNCYIGNNILNLLSSFDFRLVIFSEFLTDGIHMYKDRIKILNGFKLFIDQLGILSSADNINQEEEFQVVSDLNITYYSGNIIKH